MDDLDDIVIRKANLRDVALKRRAAIDERTRARLAEMLAAVGPGLVEGAACVVSLYAPIGSEPDPMRLATALHAAGHRLALPVDWSHGAPLHYRAWTPGDRLATGPLGIAEPLEDAARLEPDLLFVPVLAFDRRGNRLGYGAGNVDRTVAGLRARKNVRVVGIAYAAQEEASVPVTASDEPLDLVVTENGLLRLPD